VAKKKVQPQSRIPIVAILGHVDHGKTTILDSIRKANVQSREVGGITQKISAFTVDVKGKKITFIDTPGHEAFDLMRTRGGSIADIVLLIVAADDSVKPQTEESIEIINKSDAKPIVVINKVDLPNINVEKVKRDVANKGISVEGMGGKVPVALVSGKNGTGIEELLETILLVAEIEGVKQRPELPAGVGARAYVLETVKEMARGNVSSIVVAQGKIRRGDLIGYKSGDDFVIEKVKGFISEDGEQIEELDTGYGGRVIGLSSLIDLGAEIFVVEKKDEKLLAGMYKDEIVVKEELPIAEADVPPAEGEAAPAQDLSFLFGEAKSEEKKTLKVIIRASAEGALEAIIKSLSKIDSEGYTVEVINSKVGDISMSDVETAEVTKAIILGFEVSADRKVMEMAQKKRVLVRTYDIVYKLIDEISEAIASLAEPKETEEEIGQAEVRALFTLSDGSLVIGCRVKEGVVKKGGKCYIVRGDDIISEGRITSLRTQKDTINEAKTGQEFGAIFDSKVEAEVGDTLYCYKVIK
jgi:translation initiation factor IF-2